MRSFLWRTIPLLMKMVVLKALLQLKTFYQNLSGTFQMNMIKDFQALDDLVQVNGV